MGGAARVLGPHPDPRAVPVQGAPVKGPPAAALRLRAFSDAHPNASPAAGLMLSPVAYQVSAGPGGGRSDCASMAGVLLPGLCPLGCSLPLSPYLRVTSQATGRDGGVLPFLKLCLSITNTRLS